MEHSNFRIISYSAHVHVKTGVCQLGFMYVLKSLKTWFQ